MTEKERQAILLEIEILSLTLKRLEEQARPIKERLEQLEIDYLLGTIERQCFLTGCSRPLLAANSPNFPLYHMLAILSSENSLCNLHKIFPFQSRSFYLQFIKKFVIIIIEIEREINLLKISKKNKKKYLTCESRCGIISM